jgi:hypothetical protein
MCKAAAAAAVLGCVDCVGCTATLLAMLLAQAAKHGSWEQILTACARLLLLPQCLAVSTVWAVLPHCWPCCWHRPDPVYAYCWQLAWLTQGPMTRHGSLRADINLITGSLHCPADIVRS